MPLHRHILIAALHQVVAAKETYYHGTSKANADKILKHGYNAGIDSNYEWMFNKYIMEEMLRKKGLDVDADEIDEDELLDMWFDNVAAESGTIIFLAEDPDWSGTYGDVLLKFTPPKDAIRMNTKLDDMHGIIYYYHKTIPGKYFEIVEPESD